MDKNRTAEREQQVRSSREKPLTIGDFLDLRDQLFAEIKAMLKNVNTKDGRRWLKALEVRKILKISAGKLQYLRDKGKIPFTKLGGVTYYDINQIEEMMEVK